MGQQLADMARAFDVSATVRQFTTTSDVASRLLGPLNLGASPLIRLAEDAAQAYGRMAGLGRLPRELEQFRPIIEQHAAAVLIAPDEATRRLTTDEAIRAMFEVATGIETRPGYHPEQRFKFWFSILWALWVVLWSAQRGTAAGAGREPAGSGPRRYRAPPGADGRSSQLRRSCGSKHGWPSRKYRNFLCASQGAAHCEKRRRAALAV